MSVNGTLDRAEDLRHALGLVEHERNVVAVDEAVRIGARRSNWDRVVECDVDRTRWKRDLLTDQGALPSLTCADDGNDRRVVERDRHPVCKKPRIERFHHRVVNYSPDDGEITSAPSLAREAIGARPDPPGMQAPDRSQDARAARDRSTPGCRLHGS